MDAMTPMRTFHPKKPNLADIDLKRWYFNYDRRSDTLMVYIHGKPQPAVSVLVNDHLYYRVDPETENVVGYQIEDFLAEVVYEHPAFLAVAEAVGVEPRELEEIRRTFSQEQRNLAAAESLVGHLAPLGALGAA